MKKFTSIEEACYACAEICTACAEVSKNTPGLLMCYNLCAGCADNSKRCAFDLEHDSASKVQSLRIAVVAFEACANECRKQEAEPFVACAELARYCSGECTALLTSYTVKAEKRKRNLKRAQVLIVSTVLLLSITAITRLSFAPNADASTVSKNGVRPYSSGWNTWSTASLEEVLLLKKKFGEPSEATPSFMVWTNTGPFKRTVVYAKDPSERFPIPHDNILEQVVTYKVPPSKLSELGLFNGALNASLSRDELSVCSSNESINFLTLNLANDIVLGKRDVKNAREFYKKTFIEYRKGVIPEYMSKLHFGSMEHVSIGVSKISVTDTLPPDTKSYGK